VLVAGGLWPEGQSVPNDGGVIDYLLSRKLIAPGAGTGPAEVGAATAMLTVTGTAKTDGFALDVTVTVTAAVVDCACSGKSAAEKSRAATEAAEMRLRWDTRLSLP